MMGTKVFLYYPRQLLKNIADAAVRDGTGAHGAGGAAEEDAEKALLLAENADLKAELSARDLLVEDLRQQLAELHG